MAHFSSDSEYLPEVVCDFSDIEQTCCYCSDESADIIRKAISRLPLKATHLIGTGDYHYISLFWLERITEPFELILFDNHPDDQPTAFGDDILSCGSWVARARALPKCKSDIWIRESDKPALSRDTDLPVYISVDLDVLSHEYAHTDWDQGTMSLDWLCHALETLRLTRRIIGADICGGIAESQGGSDSDQRLNAMAIARIFNAINKLS